MVQLYMIRTCKNGVLKVIHGDLSKQSADVMISPADNRLSGREGLDAEIHNLAGPELLEVCRGIASTQRVLNQPPCQVGTAVKTKAFGLDAKHLIHVVGPDCRRPKQDENRRELLPLAYNALFDALSTIKGVKTVVSPPISMGVFAYPHREGARMTLEILLDWLDNTDRNDGITEFTLIVKEKNFISNMRTVYRENEDQLPGEDITPHPGRR